MMTFNDFLGFAREFELLHKYVTQHDLKQLFSHALREGGMAEAAANANATVAAAVAAAAAAAGPPAAGAGSSGAVGVADPSKRQLGSPGGPSSSTITADDDDDGSGPASVPKELNYRCFLELLAAVSHYVIRNPYFALHDRVDKFILSVLASRKKLPQKVYRSAV